MLITKIFTFDSAHHLTNYNGKCENMHGQTYKLEVTVEGEMQENGLVVDFYELKQVVQKNVIDKLDHVLLNDIIENPSAENIVSWVWDQLIDRPELNLNARLYEIVLWETAESKVVYKG